jgi:hypothetical protein
MRKTLSALTLMVLLIGAGCITGPPTETKTLTPAQVLPQRPPTVFASQVNENNAHEMAQALARELDFDAQSQALHTPPDGLP